MKLVGRKANLLSMAGRTVLIQASSSAIPSYIMQSCMLPRKVLEGIDRVNRNFLWNSSDSSEKMHWVGWRKVAKTKRGWGVGSPNGQRKEYGSARKVKLEIPY